MVIKKSFIALAATLLIAAAGCSPERSGVATPAPSPPVNPTSSPSGSTSGNVFGDLKACDLLEPTTSAKGFDPPAAEQAESNNGCATRKKRYGSARLYLVAEAGIDQLSAGQGTKNPTKIGNRDAVEIPGDAGTQSCTVAVAVTSGSRLTASTGLNEGTNEEACALSREIAEAAEPKLPRGN
ncbi:DUF3558 family protein [Amycolatopsis azurea]|uniref:DUF3558 domain-containing protein n=1 Tax=Amycolatopsis azurea DSM 43854 TaxID=1238180 RepID=A0ABX3JH40_9PSEU|nr:DUF3558 family protein [Amycolatopsis azurea]OOC07066.1 hypothetical protein B0293_08305 [Amycolatopsis azurea DSM 43854]